MEGEVTQHSAGDSVAGKLRGISHWILIAVFGLLPLIFIPGSLVPLALTKVTVVVLAVLLAVVFFSLSVLRSGRISFSLPYALFALWGVAIVSVVSALLSGDVRDALFGDVLGIHTAAFVVLIALSSTLWTFLEFRKENVVRLYMLIILSTTVLVLFHVARLIFGADFLSFGIFGANSSPIGSWNDLALLLGLAVLLALVTLEQLSLTAWGKMLFGVVIAAALVMLAVINFLFVWVVLGLVSAVMVIYALSKDRFSPPEGASDSMHPMTVQTSRTPSMASLIFPVIVCVISGTFVLGGGTLSRIVSDVTQISYIEVRPSFTTTADIAEKVYKTEAFLGVGTNRFADAWRVHKADALNNTPYWNVNFQSGSGYIPTFFVTTGVLGGVAWLIFLLLFVWGGLRMILRGGTKDTLWSFVGTSSFVGASFIWGMSLVYVPGAAILLLGALCTGLTFVAQGMLRPEAKRSIQLATNRKSGFVLTLAVVVLIAGTVGVMYISVKQYGAVYLFAEGAKMVQAGGNIEDVEQTIVSAFNLAPNDAFARQIASYEQLRLNTLLNLNNPTDEQKQQFQSSAATAVRAAQLAVDRDGTDPENWSVLGRLYRTLAIVGVDGAYDAAKERLERARDLDPKNPRRVLDLAVLEVQADNLDEAHSLAEQALTLKSNYSDALFLLTQIEVSRGNVASAIDATKAMIGLSPQDATRYYQLGVLEASRQNHTAAVSAFESAISLNKSYSNARYFLALSYVALGQTEDALRELRAVQELNPDNELVAGLIQQLETTGTIAPAPTNQIIEDEADEGGEALEGTEDDVTTDEAPNTPLVTPVNTPPEGTTNTDTGLEPETTN